jgi:hypothetical protein
MKLTIVVSALLALLSDAQWKDYLQDTEESTRSIVQYARTVKRK